MQYFYNIMKVFKFGGASIQDADKIRNVATIIKGYPDQQIVIVASALGKTTNALEQVVDTFMQNDLPKAKELFSFLEITHNALAQDLMQDHDAATCITQLQNIYAEADWILHDKPVREYDYYYDQIVCLGELMSTTLLHHYFTSIHIKNTWQDIRDVFRTDTTWREANIDVEFTKQQVHKTIGAQLGNTNIVITQGFIGCTDENESTTLGREGSDYSAALLANMLDAESVTIWKDVKGLLSGDPKLFDNVSEIKTISYYEVIEMAYYGAQVIHPKTIKPLYTKNIPLYVKCFLDPALQGTVIQTEVENANYPPILVLKKKQTLLQLFSKDYSFITDDKLSEIYNTFHNLHTHINIIQNAAISFLACIDDNKTKVEAIYKALENDYKILRNDDVELLTIRHYTADVIAEHIGNKTIILEQKSRHTIQVVLKP
jgi:aspartate kinase